VRLIPQKAVSSIPGQKAAPTTQVRAESHE